MDRTLGVDLPDSEYVVTPSEAVRGMAVGSYLKSMVGDETGEYHLYDVVTADREPVLEVAMSVERSTGSGFVSVGSLDKRLVFRSPDDTRRLTAERTGIGQRYTVTDPTTATTTATIRKGLRTLGRWQLLDDRDDTVGVVKQPVTEALKTAVSFSHHATYRVESPDGEQLARFEHERLDDSVVFSELSVELTSSAVPSELLIVLAVVIMRGNSSSQTGDA